MNNTELIKELKDCIALHMNPYNLGDMGRTTELIIEACNRLQKLEQCNVSGALPLTMLSEEEFAKKRATSPVDKFRSSQFKKGMYAGYLETLDMLQRQ